jgi:hypothetical protein
MSYNFISSPTTVLQKFLKSCARSAFFLALYVSIGFATPCVVRPVTGCERPWHYYLTGATAGAMVLFEANGRQLGKEVIRDVMLD